MEVVPLAPCPLCGGDSRMVGIDRIRFVACEARRCRCLGPIRQTEAAATRAWNKRRKIIVK